MVEPEFGGLIIMYNEFDFIAILKYKTFDEGGRSTPAKSGYRPQLCFDFEKNSTSGRQVFIDKEWVCPGESVEAKITMLSPQLFENKLYEGLEFKFCEGRTIVGYGAILKILNEKLIRK